MKLVMLMYLEDDDDCVTRLLSEQGIPAFSRFAAEGVGPGAPAGWYGRVAPYEARMAIAVLPDAMARSLLAAVEGCRDVQDPRHPIRAVQLAVEAAAQCRFGEPGEGSGGGTERESG